MEIVFVFLCLLIILFIGQVVYSEKFADCSSPGALTWTISMNPSSCSVTNPLSGSVAGSRSAPSAPSAPTTSAPSAPATATSAPAPSAPTFSGTRRSGSASAMCDSSGSNINLSISDLLALVGSTSSRPQQVRYQSSTWTVPSDYQKMYGRPSNQMHRSQMHSQMNQNQYGMPQYGMPQYGMPQYGMPNQHQTPSVYQGSQYIQNAPSMNPADYIRKDSIPCYACNLA